MTMGPVQCTRFRFTLVKLQGLGMEAPEKQWGKHHNQRQAAARGWGRQRSWRLKKPEKAGEGLLKRGRKPGPQGEQPAAVRKKQSMGRYGHHHHYGLGAVARSPSPLGARWVVWHVCGYFDRGCRIKGTIQHNL